MFYIYLSIHQTRFDCLKSMKNMQINTEVLFLYTETPIRIIINFTLDYHFILTYLFCEFVLCSVSKTNKIHIDCYDRIPNQIM